MMYRDEPTLIDLVRGPIRPYFATVPVSEPDRRRYCESFEEALGSSGRTHPDIFVVDTPGVGVGALGTVAELRALFPQTPIILVVESPTTDEIVAALDAGADDVVRAETEVTEYHARIRRLLKRRAQM